MVKCVVSSCLNRDEGDRGFSRAPKRFFSFPQDPARVKVWLAALREPDKQDWSQNHVICEDHFLPEDVSGQEVHPDAIPIMPPCLEDELGLDAWAEDPEDAWNQEPEEDTWNQEPEEDAWNQEPEEDTWNQEPEEEEEGWNMEDEGEQTQEDQTQEEEIQDEVNHGDEEVKDEAKGEENTEMKEQEEQQEPDEDEAMEVNKEEEPEETPAEAQTAEHCPLQVTQRSTGAADGDTAPPADPSTESAEVSLTPSSAPALAPPTSLSSGEPKKILREDKSLLLLTRPFLELLLSNDGSLDVREAARTLQSPKRRVYDITNILMGAELLKKEAVNRVRWTGKCPISSFLWEKQNMQQESEKLKQVEDALDGLIKSCAQQLFSMTDDRSNANSAFVTYDDVANLAPFQDQTVMVVKAPEETKLEVPAPKEDSIQVHLKSGSGPISVLTFDKWPDVTGKIPRVFKGIQYSHIKTKALQTESSSQSSVISL